MVKQSRCLMSTAFQPQKTNVQPPTHRVPNPQLPPILKISIINKKWKITLKSQKLEQCYSVFYYVNFSSCYAD
jgi:hypothetical protein